MKYLILPIEEGERLNCQKAVDKGAVWIGAKMWAEEKTETETALAITDDSELTQEQVDLCVDVLPERFIKTL